jgi:NAD(P)-dependent dehydrogenase (short-subunit alcohol dehydrogenase family)
MPLSPIAKGDVEIFDKVIATNLRGTFLVFSQAAQHVAEGGRIIAFSSSVLARRLPAYGSVSPTILPASSPSWPALTADGSTLRYSSQTAASPNSQSALWTPLPTDRNQGELS